jgi:hypothetical protein
MPPVPDFRTLTFDLGKVDASGMAAGRSVYRKLYAIENVLRVVVHSILTVQIGSNWWVFAANSNLQRKVLSVRANYAASPGRAPASRHDLYYTFFPDLNEIMRANSHLFLPVVPDIDIWIARIERLRIPRNLVGHMNWPSAPDRQLIQMTYSELKSLLRDVSQAGVAMLIP